MKLELNKVYKDKMGDEWKVVFIAKGDMEHSCMALNKKENNFRSYCLDGRYYHRGVSSQCDLIMCIGYNFEEDLKPFKLEFQANVISTEWNSQTRKEIITLAPTFHSECIDSPTYYLSKLRYEIDSVKVTIEGKTIK